jgi:hypothetical protein
MIIEKGLKLKEKTVEKERIVTVAKNVKNRNGLFHVFVLFKMIDEKLKKF